MDWLTDTDKIREVYKKYRYVAVIILAGILLMLIPQKQQSVTSEESKPVISSQESLETRLERLLGQLYGAGKVRVLLTEAAGEQILYQTDDTEDSGESSQNIRKETVVISGADRGQQGLITQTIAPRYQGAVVLCQGADSASVRLAIIEAVSSATGLSSHHISVLKMK